jgi:hypothetical protein
MKTPEYVPAALKVVKESGPPEQVSEVGLVAATRTGRP